MQRALPEGTVQTLDAVAAILLRCFVLTVIAMLFVWAVVFLMGDGIYQMHAGLFDLTRKEFNLFLLYFLTFIKSLNVVFCLIPYVAIKLVLRDRAMHKA